MTIHVFQLSPHFFSNFHQELKSVVNRQGETVLLRTPTSEMFLSQFHRKESAMLPSVNPSGIGICIFSMGQQQYAEEDERKGTVSRQHT